MIMNWIILGVVFILTPQLRPDRSSSPSLAESSPSASLLGGLLNNGNGNSNNAVGGGGGGQLAAVQGTPLNPATFAKAEGEQPRRVVAVDDDRLACFALCVTIDPKTRQSVKEMRRLLAFIICDATTERCIRL
ncbi:hypothetical protein RP20_CCG004189 [Aedes albopictus]|nr:hypothetical protein RP20_CCG004189 [Aedes albopictus]